MAIRYYLMPKQLQVVAHGVEMDVPKYGYGLNYSVNDFGGNAIACVCMDISDADHAIIAAQPDTIAVPPLDSKLTTQQFNRFTTWCENRGLPSDRFNANMTVFQILTALIRMFQFHQRLNGLGLASIGTNLDRNIGQLPLAMRQRLQNAIVSFGWDSQYLKDGLTLRDVCKQVGSFFNKKVRFGEIDE